jgi:hypothetical protein
MVENSPNLVTLFERQTDRPIRPFLSLYTEQCARRCLKKDQNLPKITKNTALLRKVLPVICISLLKINKY